MLRTRFWSTLALGMALIVNGTASAIIIQGYTAARNDRFSSGYPAAPVPNANLLSGTSIPYNTFDYSGLGWATIVSPFGGGFIYPAGTLITPRHILSAAHFPPGNGPVPADIQFRGGDGLMHTYQISSWTPLFYNGQQSDVFLGTLSADIPAAHQVNFFPIISSGTFSDPNVVQPIDIPLFDFYVGREMLVVGRSVTFAGASFGRNRVSFFGEIDFSGGPAIDNIVTVFDFDPFGPGGFNPDEALLQEGDSGAASLMEYNGQLGLFGTHMGVDNDVTPNLNVDSFLPFYIAQINNQLQLQGSPYRVTVLSAVPEPGTLLLTGLAATVGLGSLCRRRKGRRCNSLATTSK